MAVLTATGLSAAGAPARAAAPDSTAAAADAAAVADSSRGASTTSAPAASGVVEIPRRPQDERREPEKLSRFDQPHWVMLRSLVLPGWGQFHNKAWIKGTVVALVDGGMRVRLVRDERNLTDLNDQANANLGTLSAADQDLKAAQAELAAAQAEVPPNPARIAAAQAAVADASIAYNDASTTYNNSVAAYNLLLTDATTRRWIFGAILAYSLLDAYIDAHFKDFDVDFKVDPALPPGQKTPGMRLQMGWRF
jgi:hypothetical protein